MDGYIPHPPAQDSATAGYSSAAKGGLAGVLVVLLLAIVFYVFFQHRNCLEEGDPGKVQVINIVEMGERSVHAGEQVGTIPCNKKLKLIKIHTNKVFLIFQYCFCINCGNPTVLIAGISRYHTM